MIWQVESAAEVLFLNFWGQTIRRLILRTFWNTWFWNTYSRRPEPPWKISSYRDMTKVGANMSGILLILPAEPNLSYQGPKQRTKPWSPPAGCHLCACMLSLVQRFSNPMACSPPNSSVHGIFQARILEWVTIFCFKNLPNPGIEPPYPVSPALAGGFFTKESWEAAWEAQCWGGLWSTVDTWDKKMGPTLFQLLLGFRNKKKQVML